MRTIRDCNVCVVGGAGFLGSHLVDHLIEDRGCNVLVLDNLCAGRREFVHTEAEFVHHDITGSEERMRRLFEKKGTKAVFNYAAWPYVPDSFARPLHISDVNFMGAIKVINAAQEAGVEAILQVSSAELYGQQYGSDEVGAANSLSRLTENAPVIPHSTYGLAKAAVDSYVQCSWRERKTPCIALRQFNCVGERETHPYVVPEIISQLAYQQGPQDHGLVKLGNNSFRDFLYAGDAVRIAVELLERGQYGEVYNLGSETGIKMYDLAKMIGKLMGFSDVRVEVDEARKRPWEIWHLQSDNTKIKRALSKDNDVMWGTKSLEEALRLTLRYYEESGRKWC